MRCNALAPPLSFSYALFSLSDVTTKNNNVVCGDIWANGSATVYQNDSVLSATNPACSGNANAGGTGSINAAGGSVTKTYAMAEDETSTFRAKADNYDSGNVSVTHDCTNPAAAISNTCSSSPSGVVFKLSNGGRLPVSFELTKNGTHLDPISHLTAARPDLPIEPFPLQNCYPEGACNDLSAAPPRTHITLDMVRQALEKAGVERLPEGGALLYYTGAARNWNDHMTFNTQYPGLNEEASRWILDQGVVNVMTDAVSTDNPADINYPNHRVHAEYMVNHTELVNNIDRIPLHSGFWVVLLLLVTILYTRQSMGLGAPPTTSECPPRYLVVLWTTMSAPSRSGCCKYGEAKVLATASSAPARRATSAMAAMSSTWSSGLVGVSTQTSRVAGPSSLRKASGLTSSV